MYRSAATTGPSLGVSEGPYTGGPRSVDFDRLPRACRDRLVAALRGEGAAHAIAFAPLEARWKSRTRLVLGLLGVPVLAYVWAHRLAWPLPAWAWIAAYFVPTVAILGAVFGELRARARAPFASGKYLLPLDVVEVNGRTLRVTPAGGVRHAGIERGLGGERLVVHFVHGEDHVFPIDAKQGAAGTMKLLEHAQSRLAHLSFAEALDEALRLDPFFEVRADDSWRTVRPRDTDDGSSEPMRDWAAHFGVVALSAGISFVALYAKDKPNPPPQPIAEPLAAPTASAPPAPTVTYEEKLARCKSAFAQRAPHPKSARAMAALFDAATEPDSARLHVLLSHRIEAGNVPTELDEDAIRARERTTMQALQIVLSEVCPASVLHVTRVVEPTDGVPNLAVETKVRVLPPPPGAPIAPIEVVFDARLRVPRAEDVEFRLTMPPPVKLDDALRPRSLFRASSSDSPNRRILDAQTARAYDRLYDELYGVFLAGDPRVPLHEDEEAMKPFTAP